MDPAAPGWTCARMQLTSLLIISLAQRETHAAPLGAGGSSVAQGEHKFSSLGAPRTFDLFYPELPGLSSAKKFTTEVPVIHLPEIEKSKSHEKTNAEVYLEMFPQDLLDSNKKIKPIDVRIIEHDDFIDYEIEFVELSEEQFNEYESDTTVDEGDDKNSVSKPKSDLTKIEATTQRIATTVPISTSTKVTAATFVDLLRRARRKHRKRVSQENLGYKTSSKNVETIDKNTESTEENVKVDTDDAFDTSVKVLPTASTIPSISKTEPISVLQETSLRSENKAIITNLVKQRKQISQQSGQNFGDAATIKLLQLDRRFKKTGRSTTLKPAEPTESSTSRNTHIEDKDTKLNNDVKNPAHTQIVAATPIYEILSSTNMPAYQVSVSPYPLSVASTAFDVIAFRLCRCAVIAVAVVVWCSFCALSFCGVKGDGAPSGMKSLQVCRMGEWGEKPCGVMEGGGAFSIVLYGDPTFTLFICFISAALLTVRLSPPQCLFFVIFCLQFDSICHFRLSSVLV